MKVYKKLDQLPRFKNGVITIGSFDGVHAGHRQIIQMLTSKAKEINGESVVITFDPHPRIVLDPEGHQVTLLNSLEEKISLLAKLAVDHLVVVPFDLFFSQMTPSEYITDFLVQHFNPALIIIGYDHKFGQNRSGNIHLLKSYESQCNFEVIEIEKYLIQDIAVSSTKIRKALAIHNITKANTLLSYPYLLTGQVIYGNQIGRTIGYPTANVKIDEPFKLIPPDGIYAARCIVEGNEYNAMLYIGNRPVIDQQDQKVIEINIFNFSKDIYHKSIQIKIIEFIRPDAPFNSLKELQIKIDQDKVKVEQILSTPTSLQNKKKCAVAVLNYNGENLLKKYIPELIRCSPEADLIVLDNASSDGSITYLESLIPAIHLIKYDQNYGFAEGYNRGIAQLKEYTYVVMLNSDVRVTPHWLPPLLQLMDEDSNVAAAQPKIRSELHPDYFEYAGASGGFLDRWGYPYCRGRIFDTIEQDLGQYDEVMSIDWCSGAALLIRTEIFLASGGLDEDFFAHQEEIDLCWRLRNSGYDLKVNPESTVYHVGGATLSYSSPQKKYLNYKNNLTTIIKNAPKSTLLWLIPWRFMLDKISAWKYLIHGDVRSFWAISRALTFEFFHIIPLLLKRNKTQQKTANLRSQNPNPMQQAKSKINIIIPYFLKNIKKYSELDI